ncbi:MAG: MltA domain-containing protein [Alphaproteobacteria bacterium]|nr:MltA domain-containing protein [Alphaproteobacteria bacterium]
MKRVFIIFCAVLIAGLTFYFRKASEKPSETASFLTEFPSETKLSAVDFSQLNGFETDKVLEALPALRKSCLVLKKKYKQWRDVCDELNHSFKSDPEFRSFLKKNFQPYAVNKAQKGLFTGYYEPEIEGSSVRTKEYATPVYGLPQDIVRIDLEKFNPKYKGEILFGKQSGKEITPYLTRKEIETGKTKVPADVIAWVKEPADLFILQIQGSGILKLPDGKQIGIGYDGNNGHRFTGIGSVMAKKGLLKNGVYTMSEIRDWLISNPEQAQKLMHENKRYIFFKKLDKPGAIGSLGVPLTAGRSLAVDPAYIPLGSFLWLQAEHDKTPLNRLMTAQDTGSAIKGVIRGDFFWGAGEQALKEAGRMRSQGTYFLLLPKREL